MKEISLINKNYIYIPDCNIIINSEFREKFRKHHQEFKIRHKEVSINEKNIRNHVSGLKHVLFELTRDCNLRCKYCSFNGTYFHQREREAQNIDFEIAKKAADYLYKIVKNKKKDFIIGFYGGEPLLKFSLLQRIVDYTKKVFRGWDLDFGLTTNGTIMNDEIADFFIKEKVRLTVSLDGPKENHDAKRVFANQKGSFDQVIKNLTMIRNRSEEYFNGIMFSVTVSKDLSFQKIVDFFKEYTLIKKNYLTMGFVSENDTSYYTQFYPDNKRLIDDYNNIFSLIKKKLKNKEELVPFEHVIFRTFFNAISNLDAKSFNHLGGSCLFDSRLYIDVYGRFHLCEKINDQFDYGNVNEGFNFQKMAHIAKSFIDVRKKHCMKCEMKFLCNVCYVHFAKDGEFRIDNSFCDNMKKLIKHDLGRLVELKEEGIEP
jgi:uncharacterized protein